MSLSYVVMLFVFYVDNGKQLLIWKDLLDFAVRPGPHVRSGNGRGVVEGLEHRAPTMIPALE